MTVSEYLSKANFLTKEEALEFESKFISKNAKVGEYLILEGEVCKKVFFVQQGCLSMIYELDHKSFIKDFIFQNNFASVYESFLSQEPARYSLKAITECTYQVISLHDLEKLYHLNPQLRTVASKLTESAYLNVTRRMESLITLSAEQRYLQLVERRPNLLSEVPLYLIASYLGITDVALSRIRKMIIK